MKRIFVLGLLISFSGCVGLGGMTLSEYDKEAKEWQETLKMKGGNEECLKQVIRVEKVEQDVREESNGKIIRARTNKV